MKIENRPEAYGFVAGLLVILLGVVATCSSCAHAAAPPAGFPRTEAEQIGAAYRVTVYCIDDSAPPIIAMTRQSGSAVLLDSTRLLTALHVIECAAGSPAITLLTVNGRHYTALPARVWKSKDIVELSVTRPLDGMPATIGPVPKVGDRLCSQHGSPAFGEACGDVLYVESSRPDSDIVHTAHIEHGNSGGGVYDARGRLIGITTQLILCIPGFDLVCGGRTSSLEGLDL